MSYAIVTPSFAGDYERCRLLAQSIQRLVKGDHYILVDGMDVPLFKSLEGYGAKVIDSRELMDKRLKRVPRTRLWLSPRPRVIRGWMTQQIRKMAFAFKAPTERVLFVDSDVVFVRPFDPDAFTKENKTPLFTIDWFNEESLSWCNQSRRMLGVPEQKSSRGYAHPTFWRRSTVRGLLETLENRMRRPWQETIASQRTFSEYALYGIYAEELVGLEKLGMYSFNEPLMHLSWEYNLRTVDGMGHFFTSRPPESYAMMFHSKWRVPVSVYEDRIRSVWAAAEAHA